MKLVCRVFQSPFSYDIDIRDNLLDNLEALASEISHYGNKCALITDSNVVSLFGEKIHEKLTSLGIDTTLFSFPAGEFFKTRKTKEDLEDELLQKGFGRDSVIVALGGGVVMDVVGFLASTYCRGVPLITVPTTLLAMVDAAVGGKVAVNVPYGKNLIGSFYQPRKVFIDPTFLSTLPLHEYKNGLVEMIKHGLVLDSAYFSYLENHREELLTLNKEVLEVAIFESCRIKKMIVEEDEKDLGKRNLLNFGHTVGHALENITNYTLSHGEAVAIGCAVESYLAVLLGHLRVSSFHQIMTLLQNYDVLPEFPKVSIEDLLQAMTLDKKSKMGKPHFVILGEIGRCIEGDYCLSVSSEFLREAIEKVSLELLSIN